MASERITSHFVSDLLRQPSIEAQSALLQKADLFNPVGLSRLLEFARQAVGNHPDQARRLAVICVDVAEGADALAIVPQATYLRAQTHAINGEFSQASALIKSAREQYLLLGQVAPALRTNVGLISVLAEEGQYQEAIRVGLSTLETITQADQLDLTSSSTKALSGLIHKNLGICYELIGNYDQSLNAFSRAEALFEEADMQEERGALAMSRGSILLSAGRAVESLKAFQAAALTFAGMDNRLRQARCLNNMGNAHLMLGNYSQCLETLREARLLLSTMDARVDQLILQGLTADAYLALNLYPEAIAEYQAANEGLSELDMAYQRAWVLWGLGAALIAQSQWESAEAELSEAAKLFQDAGNKPLLSAVLLEQATLMLTRNERGAAIDQARRALQMVTREEYPVQRVYALLRLADLVLPVVSLAEALLLEAEQIIIKLAIPHLRYRVHQRLGHLLLLQRRDQDAEPLLQAAIRQIELLRGNLNQEAIRVSFLRDKIAAYEDLAQLYLLRGDEESLQKALRVTEQAKSRTLADLIVGLVDTKLAINAEPEENQRLQDLRAELDATYNQALRGTQDGERAIPWQELNERATALTNEISRLSLGLAENWISKTAAHVLSFDTIQEQLSPDLTMLIYHILGDEVLVFVYRNGRVRVKRRLTDASTVQWLLQDLTMEWARFQVEGSFIHRHLKHLEKSAQRVLKQLYRLLVAPVAGWLPAAEAIVPRVGIVPHGLLHEVPFQALFDGNRYLIDRFELVYAPSATLLAHYQKPKPLRNDRAIIFGVSDPLIPGVIAETQAVAQHLSQNNLYLDEHATLAAFQSEALQCGVLHLACHGLFRTDNPMFSALRLHDGWLTAADVLALDLTDTFVTLSACESGRNDAQRGDEILGLTRAFLGAGTRALVVTLWLVEDQASASLMACFYEQLAHGARYASALRTAQRILKEKHPHPYYWAPFILIGQMDLSS